MSSLYPDLRRIARRRLGDHACEGTMECIEPGMPRAIQLRPGETGLFGYGSLLQLSSMEESLCRRYTEDRFKCHVRGWRRTWGTVYPNNRYYYVNDRNERRYPKGILYLNVSKKDDILNGVVYVIPDAELATLDAREKFYDRVDVAADLTDLSVSGGPVWMYVGKPEHAFLSGAGIDDAAVRWTYLEIVEAGLTELGPQFREEYVLSSDAPPSRNIIEDHAG